MAGISTWRMDCVLAYLGEVMNIIELAKQAGFVEYELDDGTTEAFDKRYAKFAELVAAQEREECAELCMAVPRTGAYFARLIRARGTT